MWTNFWKRNKSTLRTTQEPSDDSELSVKKPKESWVQRPKPQSKLTPWPSPKTSQWPSPELNSRNSVWRCSSKPSLQSKRFWKIQEWARTKFTMLSWSVDRPEFPKLLNCSKNISMENNPTNPSILMKPLLMEPQSKPQSWKVMEMKPSTHVFCSMLLHYHSVLKLQVESWPNWLKETQPFQTRNRKSLPLMLTISQVSASKSSKVKDPWQKTTISLEALIWTEFHQPQEAFHKLK